MKLLHLLLPLLFVSAVVPTLTISSLSQQYEQDLLDRAALKNAQSEQPSTLAAIVGPTLITPTIYCVGGSGQPPCAPINPTLSVAPTGGTVTTIPGSPAPSAGGITPNPTAPCTPTTTSGVMYEKSKVKASGGFIEQFFKFILRLLEFFLQFLGISPSQGPAPTPAPSLTPSTGPQPTTGAPNPDPSPTTALQPCPEPTSGTQPTTATQPTTVVPSTPVGGVTPPTTSGAAGDPTAFWIHWNSTPASDAMLATEAKRRKVILLNAWEGGLIPKLKAANPNILVFAYKDLTSTRSYACKGGVDDASVPTGVGYCFADKNHPDWFMEKPGGGRFEYSGYSGHWQMDVGNPAYQQAWINNVKTELTAKKFDGVIMDNALFACDDYHGGTCPTKYPNDEVFQAAYVSMLTNAKTQLNAAGLKTMANLNGARTHAGVWKKYMAHLDGGFDEFWMAFSSSDMLPAGGSEGWEAVMEEITFNESQGKLTLVQPHFSPGDTKAFRYTFASYLMANGGNASYSEISQRDGYGDPPIYHPEFDWNLGAASGAYTSAGSNTFKREFKCGAVVVNANASGNATVALGKSYMDESGATVTSVSLPGKSGSILRIANCTP